MDGLTLPSEILTGSKVSLPALQGAARKQTRYSRYRARRVAGSARWIRTRHNVCSTYCMVRCTTDPTLETRRSLVAKSAVTASQHRAVQDCSVLHCTALRWTRLDWAGLEWTGLDWNGLEWTELNWTGLGFGTHAPSACNKRARQEGRATSLVAMQGNPCMPASHRIRGPVSPASGRVSRGSAREVDENQSI
eukprot:5458364-Pyramimonas_sp.AAC.1